jgi:predicted AAA+ superfamily ATPase
MVRRLQPWFVNATKRLVKSPKVYVRDSGILHALLNLGSIDDILSHPIAGTSWEGFVIEQVFQFKPPDTQAYFYRTHDGAECDVVLVKGIKPIACIEIKISNAPTISRGFYESVADLKPEFKFVLTPDSDEYNIKEDVTITSLRNFLKTHLPII